MASKQVCNVVGMQVLQSPHRKLKSLFNRLLTVLSQFPVESAYRRSTEHIVKQRLQLTESEPDILKLEQKIGCGEIEEVFIQAKNEFTLAQFLLKEKVWEPLKNDVPKDQWKWPC
ncbi:hypothetical protein GJ496_011561 [Pomphorhynchus laevis]|nr:hypothetical protein GJ496_011561 [Pomphorhynchus laevis]